MSAFLANIYRPFEWFVTKFYTDIIESGNWRYLTNGLLVTLRVTFFALLLGIAIGIIIAVVRSSWDLLEENLKKGPSRFLMRFLDAICRLYLTVIRGTPVIVQIFVMFFVIFPAILPSFDKNAAAILTFGINSGAYVAEIIRGGIMSIDKGQSEAGRSLGFGYVPTMLYIVLPQAVKNILPALANEFIVLLKETAIFGVIGGSDLMRGADIIISITYSATVPLITIAVMYLVMVMFFSWLVGILERRLRKSDH